MKKYLSFLIVLLLSFCVSVNAENDIVVENVTVDSKTIYNNSDKIISLNKWCVKAKDGSWDSCEENDIRYIFASEDECIKKLAEYDSVDDTCYEKIQNYNGKVTYEVEDDLSFNETQIDLSINLHEVEDYIKYKIELKNNTSKEVTITELNLGLKDSDYIKYELSGDTKISANSTSAVYLTITYSNYVELGDNACMEGYNENQNLKLNYDEYMPEAIITDESEEIENPKTNTNTLVLISSILILSILAILLILNKNKYFKKYSSDLLIFISIIGIITPLLVKAEVETNLIINTNITIDNNIVCCTWRNSSGHEDLVIGKVGMKWEDNLFTARKGYCAVLYLGIYDEYDNDIVSIDVGCENFRSEYSYIIQGSYRCGGVGLY